MPGLLSAKSWPLNRQQLQQLQPGPGPRGRVFFRPDNHNYLPPVLRISSWQRAAGQALRILAAKKLDARRCNENQARGPRAVILPQLLRVSLPWAVDRVPQLLKRGRPRQAWIRELQLFRAAPSWQLRPGVCDPGPASCAQLAGCAWCLFVIPGP